MLNSPQFIEVKPFAQCSTELELSTLLTSEISCHMPVLHMCIKFEKGIPNEAIVLQWVV